MAKKRIRTTWIWVILFVLALIVIYVISLGKLDLSNTQVRPNIKSSDEFKDTKEQALNRHKKLKELIERKEELKVKLNKRFKRTYFAVRFLFFALWTIYISVFIYFGNITDLEGVLNYSEAAILAWLTLNFLTFGRLSNLNKFLDLIKIKIENWVWGKYVSIEEDIKSNKTELKQLASV